MFLVFALLVTAVTRARDDLEGRVAERTAGLARANEDLKLEIAERNRAEEAMRQTQGDLARISRVTTNGGTDCFTGARSESTNNGCRD